MKRVAFTIVFNGLHHLKHNDFADRMSEMFDLWAVVEGPAYPGGSTSWCNYIPEKYITDGHSNDGTLPYMVQLTKKHHNVVFVMNRDDAPWKSKDDMVNAALNALRDRLHGALPTYLWEVDVDEQWDGADLYRAECMLEYSGARSASFLCDYYVGPNLLAKGAWGEGRNTPYIRLWRWDGSPFISHEPVRMEGYEDPIAIPVRFQHYAYYFEKDVEFKQDYYDKDHSGILEKWRTLQQETKFPQPISRLLNGGLAKTHTVIVKCE